METQAGPVVYANLSQRVAATYLKFLSPFVAVPITQEGEAAESSLHAFFTRLYHGLYEQPALFGLPLKPDVYIVDWNKTTTKEKATITTTLDRPRTIIQSFLDLLYMAGQKGILVDGALALPLAESGPFFKTPKNAEKFLQGVSGLGLTAVVEGEQVILRAGSEGMLLALQALAQACAAYKDQKMGLFLFVRCDFRALQPKYTPDPLEIYRIFAPEEAERLSELHRFLLDLRCKPSMEFGINLNWVIKYTPRSGVKSSPFFETGFLDRSLNPLTLRLKLAASSRVVPLLESQPEYLRADFRSRINRCNGEACNWCANKKGLGPITLDYKGEKITICWYVNSDIDLSDDHAVQIIKDYALLHEHLAPLN